MCAFMWKFKYFVKCMHTVAMYVHILALVSWLKYEPACNCIMIVSYAAVNKPEPIVLKILPIIPSSTSQKFHRFYSQIISYYSHIILLPFLFQVVTSIHLL